MKKFIYVLVWYHNTYPDSSFKMNLKAYTSKEKAEEVLQIISEFHSLLHVWDREYNCYKNQITEDIAKIITDMNFDLEAFDNDYDILTFGEDDYFDIEKVSIEEN